MQKLLSAAILSITLVIFFTAFAWAGEKATKKECIAKCKLASQLIKEVGLDDALAKISNKDSGFIWKNSYVFCF
ncbi:MAG: sodium:calcium antiporter, partial [Bacteroidetes bacterium]|nr:sodium:calcium antiporter [Bacteroidota bacterium]